VRIVGGAFRGHRLAPAPKRGVRPTADPVREALFNIVGARVGGRAFVDLCAGTGAVGLEALSRGADPVWLVERARGAVAVIRRNLERLGLDEADGRVRVVGADCSVWIEREAEAALAGVEVGVVFLDPPYGERRRADWLSMIAAAAWLSDETLVVVEHRHDEPVAVPSMIEAWSKRYGDTGLTGLHRKLANVSERSRALDGNGEHPLI
jgi:16S rRNA (guanine966-N2)-methyltransferase